MDARTESRTYSFMALSTVGHVALAIGIMTVQIQIQEPKDITQIEIISSAMPAAASVPMPMAEAPIVSETPKAEPIAAVQEQEEEIAAAVVPVQKVAKAPKAVVAQKPTPAPKAARALSPKPIAAVLPVVENTDLESPVAEAATELQDEDIADDLSKIDQEENLKVAAVHDDLSKETDQELKEQEAKFAAIQKENEAESQKMALENIQKRTQEKQALAVVSAKHAADAKAAADAKTVADAKAAQAQQAAERARQAEAAKQAEQARILQAKQQQDAANAAAAALAAKNAAGSGTTAGNDIRALTDLKQMPGNVRPKYDSQDRLHRREGEVAFLAYVSREGSIVNYKMLKSSGYRELDSKTLKAIRNWKFYPGQEGWVEIPYSWTLKGDAQEMPTTLRRRAQVSQNK